MLIGQNAYREVFLAELDGRSRDSWKKAPWRAVCSLAEVVMDISVDLESRQATRFRLCEHLFD